MRAHGSALCAARGQAPRSNLGRRWLGTKCHVWTTPSKQGRSGMLRRGRVRSCVRPTLRGLRTAGPDAIRSLAPKQIYALEWRITLDGLFQAPGSTGSPSRHHRPPHPSAVATADGVPSASGCATWDCCRPAIGFSTHQQSPYDPRRFVSLCHRDEPCGPAFEQAFEPAGLGCGFASGMPDHRGCTQHEQSAQVAITLFGNPSLALFAAAAVLSGHQPDPGRKLPSGVELKRIGNRGDDRRCRDRPDTGNSGEAAAGLVVFVPRQDRYLDLLYSPVQCLKFRGQPAKRLAGQRRAARSSCPRLTARPAGPPRVLCPEAR